MSNQRTICYLLFAICYGLQATTPLWAQEARSPVKVLAFHAQRYQDFQRNRVQCEIFGEIKNLSDRLLKSVVVEVEFLDEKGRHLTTEEARLVLRVIVPGNARGEARSIRPQEIGNFNQDTVQCPERWLEGRIRWRIKNLEWE